MNILPESANTLPESVNTLPESINTLPESVNTLPESVNTLPESVNTLPESVNTLPESVNTLPESINTLPEAVNGLGEVSASSGIGDSERWRLAGRPGVQPALSGAKGLASLNHTIRQNRKHRSRKRSAFRLQPFRSSCLLRACQPFSSKMAAGISRNEQPAFSIAA
jgi:uncharacterized protein YoxC